MPLLSDLGKFPASGEEGREKKLFYKLTEDNSVKMISGKRTPQLISVWCSNDVVQFGSIKILSGGVGPQQTEVDSHPGDAVFYVTDGPMTFFFPDRGETMSVNAGERMYIPADEKYKIINYGAKTIRAIFAIAPDF